jgi:gamma-glutamyltranspeptidase / glutathione hydrolase
VHTATVAVSLQRVAVASDERAGAGVGGASCAAVRIVMEGWMRRSVVWASSLVVLAMLLIAGCGRTGPPVADDAAAPRQAEVATLDGLETPAPPAHPVPYYGVNAAHPAAVEAGMTVLAAGGNAVDAAIATAYAAGVAEPFGSGIGGGGAALVVEQGGEPVAYDYRDVVNRSGQIPASEIGVPGFVAGMEALHADYGTLDRADLVAPAIAVAEDGVETYEMLAHQVNLHARRMPQDRLPHFFPGGRPLQVGERLVQPELADTLRVIADGGAAAFYEGALAEALAAAVEGVDGASLAAYDVRRREPVAGPFGDYTVVSAPPPLAGATLVQMLQVAEALGLAEHEPGSAAFVHALAMGWRVANHFRTWQLADPDFVEVATDELVDATVNAVLAAGIPADAILEGDPGELADAAGAGETTHLTVVDADGMMVSMTNTLTSLFGSGQYALGFFLNDSLGIFGGQVRNQPPEPGKRAVSSTVPTIVLDGHGRPVLGLGSPGGSRIPNAVAGVLARWALHDMPLAEAVEAPRFHLHRSELHLEDEQPDVADSLRGRGYKVSGPPFSYYFGSVQALEIDYDTGALVGAADPRRAAAWRAEQR